MNAVGINRPLRYGYEYPWLFKANVNLLTWCTSVVVRREVLDVITCRKASSSASVSEGIVC